MSGFQMREREVKTQENSKKNLLILNKSIKFLHDQDHAWWPEFNFKYQENKAYALYGKRLRFNVQICIRE